MDMIFQTVIDFIFQWLGANLVNIIVIVVAIIIGWIIYIVVKKQLMKISRKTRLEEQTARNLLKVIRLLLILIISTAILVQFSETLGLITSLFTLVGGTIIGFAAMNTLGNLIAGIIIMTSRPFSVGDRIIYNGEYADVMEIKLIYTILNDLNKVKISVPNQTLLNDAIFDLGKNSSIRINVPITAGYDVDRKLVEKTLLEAADTVPEVLKNPAPYARITEFQDYAVTYKLFAFVNKPKQLPKIKAELFAAVLDSCNKNGIEIATPRLTRTV